ncbi:MAG: DsbA family protein [Thermoleophilaceae bacterium]
MAVRVRCITDPACVWSWAAEPAIRGLMVEFGEGLSWTFVMGGLAREFPPRAGEGQSGYVAQWLEACAVSQMPVDPRIWYEAPPSSSYPMCLAVKAAAEQGSGAVYRLLRALREGTFCLRRKLDTTEALVEAARGAGLDAKRFRIDLGSHAIVEAFGADLEEARAAPAVARDAGGNRCSAGQDDQRPPFPSFRFEGEDGRAAWVYGCPPGEDLRAAAVAAGAQPSGEPRPGVLEALKRFGRMAPVEVAAVCDLPAPKAEAELSDLALQWRARPVAVLAGRLWEPAG